jgi:hypothetical protein
MTTEPVPVKMVPPKLKVIAPVDALPINVTGVPTKLGTVEKITAPLSVTTLPERKPVSEILQ